MTATGRAPDSGFLPVPSGPEGAPPQVRSVVVLLLVSLLLLTVTPVPEEPVEVGSEAGLCADCRHAIIRPTRRGTTYLRCARAAFDTHFPRYPRLPMRACTGHEVAAE